MKKALNFLNMDRGINTKKNAIWNMVASLLYAGQAFIFLLFVTRILGTDSGGIFSISFAAAALFQTIAMYGMREFQATDIHERYKFTHYLWLRMFSNLTMLLVCCVYLFLCDYSKEKAWVVILMTIVKGIDSIDNVFNTMFQQQGRLECGSKITAIRVLLSYFCFGIAIIITKNLLYTCIIFTIVSLLILLGCICIIMPVLKKKALKWERETIRLALECFPLFLSSFASIYICNLPKYSIDHYLSEEIQGCFAVLFLPVNVVNLLSAFIFRPLLTELSYSWQEEKYEYFEVIIGKQCAWIFLITIILAFIGNGLGLKLLSFFYKIDLKNYKIEFLILLITGGLNALVMFFVSVVTTMRYSGKILIINSFGVCIGTLLLSALTKHYGMMGTVISYATVLLILSFIFGGFVHKTIIGRKRKVKDKV